MASHRKKVYSRMNVSLAVRFQIRADQNNYWTHCVCNSLMEPESKQQQDKNTQYVVCSCCVGADGADGADGALMGRRSTTTCTFPFMWSINC